LKLNVIHGSEEVMNSESFTGLMDRVQQGDDDAAARLHYVLRPVVSHKVREVLQTGDYASPLGRRVQLLLHASGAQPAQAADCLEPAVSTITRILCVEKIAELKSRGRLAISGAETVRC
jgi:hypothetical protein